MEAAKERSRGDGGAHASFWLSWSLAALSVASVPLLVLVRSAHIPSSVEANLSIGAFLGEALFLIFPLVGALIASRRPRNPIGWILLADGLVWMLTGTMDVYTLYGVATPGAVPFPVGVAGIKQLHVGSCRWTTRDLRVPAVPQRETSFREVASAGVALRSGDPMVDRRCRARPRAAAELRGVQNPFGLLQPWMMPLFWASLPLLPLCIVASVLSLVIRYRRARGGERQQIKWIAFAASVVGLLYLIAMVCALIFPSGAWFQVGSPLWLDLLGYAALISFTLVPISVGFAVLRYRLYEIDIIINRALVYGSLTISLALVYVSLVISLQYVFRALTGSDSQLVIVASTLAIAALFNPLRHRTQTLIDRRFYRSKYDARKTLEEFGARFRVQTNLGTLSDDLISVVEESVQPAHVSLWLKETERKA
jgi:hypothetical protein